MFDTKITIVGTVLTQPEPRRTTTNNTLIATFRVVSNSRRHDKENDVWVDGHQFRVRVTCWRRVAANVLASVNVGDPVLIEGRILTKEWKTEQGEPRITYEVDAHAIGHDLARGRGTFVRGRADDALVVEDPDGVPGESLGDLRAGPFADPIGGPTTDDGYDLDHGGMPPGGGLGDDASELDAVAILRQAGLEPSYGGGDGDGTGDDDQDEDEITGADAGSGGSGGRSRRRGRQPVPA